MVTETIWEPHWEHFERELHIDARGEALDTERHRPGRIPEGDVEQASLRETAPGRWVAPRPPAPPSS